MKGILPINIADAADTSQCPHCHHKPGDPGSSPIYSGKRHLIVTLEREKEEC